MYCRMIFPFHIYSGSAIVALFCIMLPPLIECLAKMLRYKTYEYTIDNI